jgi:serine/threonine protein kinase
MNNKKLSSDCPKPEELRRYSRGERTEHDFELLDKHIAACPTCQEKLEALRQNSDVLTNLIAEVGEHASTEFEAKLQKSLREIGDKLSASIQNSVQLQTASSVTVIRNYQIVESIGEGGMGCVYRAVDALQNRQVAIKVLRPDRVGSQEAVSRFYREMKLLEQLKHPNIVEAVEAGEQDGLQYLVMEYLAGVDVGQLCKRMGPLPLADACEIVRLAALALQYAHDQKILHRDVKPSNLRVTPNGVVKLLDLGLAQFCNFLHPSLSRIDQAIGTLAYMAPEQFSRHEEMTVRSDVFSLGVTFHEILTGQRPMQRPGQSPWLTELNSVRPDVDERLAGLIREMVSVAPEKRPQTMREIANRLTPYAATADLTSLVARYFNWELQRPLSEKSSIAPPIFDPVDNRSISTVNANDPVPTELVQRNWSVAATPPSRAALAKRLLWGWMAGLGTALLVVILGTWLWFGGGPEVNEQPVDAVIIPVAPPRVITGEFELLPDGDIATQFLSDGNVIATNKATKETTTINEGVNALKPGTYSITFDGPEDFKPLGDIEVVPGANRKHRLTTSLTKPFAYPTIATKVGAFATYTGTLWLKGWPDAKEESFHMKIHVLSVDEQAGSPTFVWLKFETTTHHTLGDYSETGYLKVNVDRWKTENYLDIQEGYIRASGDGISQLLEERRLDEPRNGLVVPFSKDRDWLQEIAGPWLPERRLSLQDFLSLFFGDESIRVASATIRELRPQLLASGDRNSWIESFNDSFGGRIPCYVASSRPRDAERQSMGYLLARTKVEPFGFMRMEAKLPFLKATCAISISDQTPKDTIDKNEILSAKKDCVQEPGGWSPRNQFWDLVGLPEKTGETTWQGRLEAAGSPRQFLEIVARSLGTEMVNGRMCRWIEVEVVSKDEQGDNRHWELAQVLVDEENYRESGKFDVKRGWLSIGNKSETFLLPSNRDLSEIVDQRMMLFDSPHLQRFGATDALALLFGAEFSPQSALGLLKKEIAFDAIGRSPKRTSVSILPGAAPAVQGELWELPPEARVEQKIRRTSHILFDFFDLSLKRAGMSVSLTFKSSSSHHALQPPTKVDSANLAERQRETQRRVAETSKPNWRIWTWNHAGENFRAWAEFGGMIGKGKMDDRSKWEILLRAKNSKEVKVPGAALSDEDWEWARNGRVWRLKDRNAIDSQFNVIEDRGSSIILQGRDGIRHLREFDNLADEEQAWIKAWRIAGKLKSNPTEQSKAWRDFAANVRMSD